VLAGTVDLDLGELTEKEHHNVLAEELVKAPADGSDSDSFARPPPYPDQVLGVPTPCRVGPDLVSCATLEGRSRSRDAPVPSQAADSQEARIDAGIPRETQQSSSLLIFFSSNRIDPYLPFIQLRAQRWPRLPRSR
jgi:hypothetical protein